jgi:hypothetical protein
VPTATPTPIGTAKLALPSSCGALEGTDDCKTDPPELGDVLEGAVVGEPVPDPCCPGVDVDEGATVSGHDTKSGAFEELEDADSVAVSGGGGTGEGWMESDRAVVLGASWLPVASPALVGLAGLTAGDEVGVMPAVAYAVKFPGSGSQHISPNRG